MLKGSSESQHFCLQAKTRRPKEVTCLPLDIQVLSDSPGTRMQAPSQSGDCAASKSKPTPLRSSPNPEELQVEIGLCASPLGAHLHNEAQYPPEGRQAGPPAAQCRHTVGIHRGAAGDSAALRPRTPESGSLLGARSQDSPQEPLFPENTVFPEAPLLSPQNAVHPAPPPHSHPSLHGQPLLPNLCPQPRPPS